LSVPADLSFIRLANQCWLKVASFAAVEEDYEKAIEKFEHVATTSLDNNLVKYSAKMYFLQAGLCHMCRVRSSFF
jgi:alpha-soluble NSF attachment protein